jgi:hypothetical protein
MRSSVLDIGSRSAQLEITFRARAHIVPITHPQLLAPEILGLGLSSVT